MKAKEMMEEIQNKDLTKMDNTELANYKTELSDIANNSKKIFKCTLKYILYYVIGYGCGILIGICIARVIMTYIYTGTVTPKLFLNNLLIALLCGIPAAIVSVLYRLSKRNAKNLTQVCNDKITVIDRQITINQLKTSLSNGNAESNSTTSKTKEEKESKEVKEIVDSTENNKNSIKNEEKQVKIDTNDNK